MHEENLSILALMVNASLLVQAVMAILFIASVISWIMIIQRGLFLSGAERSFREFEDTFWSGVDLNKLYQELTERAQQSGHVDGIENVFRAGFREFNRLAQTDKADPDAVWRAQTALCAWPLAAKMKSSVPTCRFWPVWPR